MGSGALLMSEKKRPPEHAIYVGTKIDVKVMRRAKAAAALKGQSVQEWLSDLANVAASEAIKEPPLKRDPPPPHPKRNPPRKP